MNPSWSKALEAYRSFNPAGWVSAYKLFPMWAGLVLVVLGVLFLIFGGGRVFRLVGGPIGAAIGYLWTPMIMEKLGISVQPEAIALAGAAFLGVMGFVFPPGLVFFAVGVPAGLVGGEFAGKDWILGFAPVCFLGGMVGAFAHRVIASAVSSLVGAWLVVIGMLAALNSFGTMVAMVTQQPWGVIIAAVLFAVAGTVYQIAVRPTPEEAEEATMARAVAKKKAEDKKALEKRWGKYGGRDE
jgi:hypothetical protein